MSVMSFACITLLGLLSGSLITIRHAIGTTVQAQIMQGIVNNAEVQSYNGGEFTNSEGAYPATYYFDDEGTLLSGQTANWIYSAKVTSTVLTIPGSPAPIDQSSTAALLQAVITARNNPNVSTTNSLVWPNTGT